MNWFKENPVLAALLALALLGTGATSYLALDAAARRTAAVEDFNTKITTLRRLQAKKPFPDPDNEKKVLAAVEAYQAAISKFKTDLAGMEVPLVEIKPQDFQDNLRNAVDELRAAATKNGVALPEKFFFGFDDFQTQLPTENQAPRLNREFTVIRKLLDQLVALPVQSIDSLVRHSASTVPEKSEEAPADKSAAETATAFDSFTLGLTATQDKFAAAIDKIPESGGFLVLRSLGIENANPVPPLRAEPTPSAPASIFPGETDTASAQLPVAFGREAVKATLLFEIPDFPEAPATPDASNPAPAN
jgi:hypothetical protein